MISSQRVKRLEIEPHRGIVPHLVIVALGHCCQQTDTASLRLCAAQPDAKDGIYDFDFCMDAHQCDCASQNGKKSLASLRLTRPQTASHTWVGFPQNLKAVRVRSASNTLISYLSDSEMAAAV